jgi:hypothetical protein
MKALAVVWLLAFAPSPERYAEAEKQGFFINGGPYLATTNHSHMFGTEELPPFKSKQQCERMAKKLSDKEWNFFCVQTELPPGMPRTSHGGPPNRPTLGNQQPPVRPMVRCYSCPDSWPEPGEAGYVPQK